MDIGDFEGDTKDEEDVHDFIKRALPDLSPVIHEHMTAFVLRNAVMTPELEQIYEQDDVMDVLSAFLMSQTRRIQEVIPRLEASIIHETDETVTVIRSIAPDLSAESRQAIGEYILSVNLQITPRYEKYVLELCARREDIRDIVGFLTGQVDEEEFVERYIDRLPDFFFEDEDEKEDWQL